MTDQTTTDVTDDERRLAREWAAFVESDTSGWAAQIRAAARVILDAVPTPPRPTLADMTPVERAACRWAQADVDGFHEKLVIATPCDDDVALIAANGGIEWMDHDAVTPRPDLPRLEWPDTEKPAPAPALPDGWRLADHEDHGRVIVTNPTPNRDGYVYIVLHIDDPLGYDWHFCDPAELTYIDQEDDQ